MALFQTVHQEHAIPTSVKQTQTQPIANQRCRRNLDEGVAAEPNRVSGLTDELALIQALQRGDSAGYEWLIREHTGKLLGIARRYLNEPEAQDAVQDTFIKAFEHIGAFRADSCLATWLHRIVINNCLSRLRRANVRLDISLESQSAQCLMDNEPTQELTPRPEQFAVDMEIKCIVRSCLANMSENYRTVILLRDIEGYSGEETAQLLGISANLVKVRLHRARRNLRDQLSVKIFRTRDANGTSKSM